jgi:Fructose-bisphosphate aldolase class-I
MVQATRMGQLCVGPCASGAPYILCEQLSAWKCSVSRCSRKLMLQGARFAKWRAVVSIPAGPSPHAVTECAYGLARYAAISQNAGLVPIVEPEIMLDGEHDIERTFEVCEQASPVYLSHHGYSCAPESKAVYTIHKLRGCCGLHMSIDSAQPCAGPSMCLCCGALPPVDAGQTAQHCLTEKTPARAQNDRPLKRTWAHYTLC